MLKKLFSKIFFITPRIIESSNFIKGCNSAVYLYSNNNGIAPCIEFKGEKEIVTCFRNYLVCVVRDSDKTILNIYDVDNEVNISL